jgi:superfamily II DNA or RNA helicase
MKFNLRDYQQQSFNNIIESFDRGINRQLAVLFTGAGKTVLFIFLIKEMIKRGKKILILVDQEDLVWQTQKRILQVDPSIVIGIEKAEYKSGKNVDVVIASVQTLGRKGNKRIKRFKPDSFDFCIIDEAHKSITPTWIRVLEYFGFGNKNFTDGNLLCGFTATPWRESGESLGILFDDIVANYDLVYGIQNGWLTDIEIYNVKTKTDISKVKTNKGDFNITDLNNTINTEDRNEEVLKAYLEYCKGEQAIIYTASVAHAHNLATLFNSHGIKSEVIEANTDKQDRKGYIKDYESKDIMCLMNHSTLTTGTDLPETRALIFARPIKSKLLFTQSLGRGLRPSATAQVDKYQSPEQRKIAIELSVKPTAKIIDICDFAGKQSVVHIPSLFGLHNELKVPNKKRILKEVVEPLEKLKKESKIDITQITNLEDIQLIVTTKKYNITSLSLPKEVKHFTNRSWMSVGDGAFEIIYSEDKKVLQIVPDTASGELLNQTKYNLLEYDTKTSVTKSLQTFGSLSGAFKIADEYADQKGYNKQLLENKKWMKEGVTEKQLQLIERFFTFKGGYKKFNLLHDRYPDTGVRRVQWKPTGEVLNKGTASKLISSVFSK